MLLFGNVQIYFNLPSATTLLLHYIRFTKYKQTVASKRAALILILYINMFFLPIGRRGIMTVLKGLVMWLLRDRMFASVKPTVQYSTVQFITVQYSKVQYSTVQYSTVHTVQ